MIVKSTHHTLHWVFGLFVAYLLVTRLFISWVQFFPNQFVHSAEWMTNAQIHLDSISIDQDILGFQAKFNNLAIESNTFQFQAQEVNVDINLFSLLIPAMEYGDFLHINKGAFESKERLDADGKENAFNIQDIGHIDTNISQLWTRVTLNDFVLNEVARPGLSVQLHQFQSLNGSRLSVVSEFSINYKSALNYERFSLKSTFKPNVWGGVENGEFSLTSFKPLEIKRLSKLLSTNWQSVLPEGELILDASGRIAKSQLASMEINLNTQALKWQQEHDGLPDNLGLSLVWDAEHQNISKQQRDWRFKLSKIQIDNRYLDSISPIELALEGDEFIRFNAEYFDIEPFKVIVKSLIKNPHIASLFDRSAYLSISNLDGRFNWKTLELPNLDIFFDRLDLPVTDYPGMNLRKLQIVKSTDNIKVSTQNPIWIMESRIHDQPMRIDVPQEIEFNFNRNLQAWSLPEMTMLIDKMPLKIDLHQLSSNYIDGAFSLDVASMSKLKSYLPYKLMSNKLTDWLQTGLLGGEQIALKGQVRGAIKNFPFNHGDGVFKVTGQVKNAVLNFNSKWPNLTNFDANLTYVPHNLEIEVKRVNIGANLIANDVLVTIPGLGKHDIAVSIKGDVEANLNNAVSYLTLSPLAGTLGLEDFFSKSAKLNGVANIALDNIWVPVSGYEKESTKVMGHVQFKDADLNVLKNIHLKHINGRLAFTEQGVSSNALSFKLFDGTGKVSVKTSPKTKKVSISGQGAFFKQENDWFGQPIPWKSDIQIPFKSAKDKGVAINLEFNLDRAESKLPEPFEVEALKNKKATLKTLIEDGVINSQFNLPGLVNANFIWNNGPKGYELTQNQIRLGNLSSTTKDQNNNQSFIQGEFEKIDVDKWIPLIKKIKKLSTNDSQGKSLHWSNSYLSAKSTDFFSYDYKDLVVSWESKVGQPLVLDINNKDVSGSIRFTSENLIDIDLQKFNYFARNRVQAEAQAPSQNSECSISGDKSTQILPTIQFKGKGVTIDGRKIDALSFNVMEDEAKLQIQNIKGAFGSGAGQLNGVYVFNKVQNKSDLNLGLQSKDVAAVTEFLKINKGFSGKSGDVSLNLSWQGGLSCFSGNEATGNIRFKLLDGSVEDIEPGFARLIGLLSVESLVRRLKLDLKDVTNKGMVYDEIKGSANIANGKVSIKDFSLKAPSANGLIKGKADVMQQTFDLEASITPKIGATVPTIAALAGTANPLAALAVYTLMKVLPGVNENLVTYKYKITGPWANPVIDGEQNKQEPGQVTESDTILDLN